ncbi:BZ3500_MvSof-1268-A1-R1_Chr2-2g04893 [Microbotryum saponariae]|uniref:BZ3500_MvSof-1268-A1-R1_Chr2-2g04893 protein n=1 Tax=Microbotryum saponariae TaxID=289078 RepID=A0A2X0K5Z4_9BASI|nr:BZ3500_MvSof-1268-A1-R1_Chr2-2g04893 [Microbotryum saponariae]SDA00423.1 BZ3501_MvSof-1269-A2-R1_Chr2-2g04567 [Microbotryum saponariae]
MDSLRHTPPLPQANPASLVGRDKEKETKTKRKKFTRRRKKKAADTIIENEATTGPEEGAKKKKKKKKMRSWPVREREKEQVLSPAKSEASVKSSGYAVKGTRLLSSLTDSESKQKGSNGVFAGEERLPKGLRSRGARGAARK